MQKQKKAFYAAAGSDDTFLRPKTGGAFAQREIAVSQKNGSLWKAWIHRKNGTEFLAASLKKPGCRGKLLTVDENARFFSKPAFLNLPGTDPVLLCASYCKNRPEIRSYRFSGGRWGLEETLALGGAVYHMDAADSVFHRNSSPRNLFKIFTQIFSRLDFGLHGTFHYYPRIACDICCPRAGIR